MNKQQALIVPIIIIGHLLTGCAGNPTASDIADREADIQRIRHSAFLKQMHREQELAEEMVRTIPEWVLNPPANDDLGIYAVGMAKSTDANTSLKKANLDAQYGLAKAYKQDLSGREKTFHQEHGDTDTTEQYTLLIDTLIDNVSVVGFQVVEQQLIPIQGRIHAYVLMRLSYEQFNVMLKKEKANPKNSQINDEFEKLEKRLSADT